MFDPERESLQQFRLTLAPTNRASPLARDEARRLFDFDDDDTAARLLTALSEVVQNAVDAHIGVPTEQHIELTFSANPPRSRVVDFAGGFDWETVRNSTPAPDSMTGRGLLLARAFVPDLTITTCTNGTTVELPFAGSVWSNR